MTALDQGRSKEIGTATIAREPSRSPTRSGRSDRTPPVALTILLVVHGLAHFVGVMTAFGAFEADTELEYLGGTWMVGNDLLIGLIGMAWAALGLAFVVAAIAVVTEFRGWERSLIMLGTLSTALCVLALWAAWIGIVVNAVVVLVALVSGGDRLPGAPRLAV